MNSGDPCDDFKRCDHARVSAARRRPAANSHRLNCLRRLGNLDPAGRSLLQSLLLPARQAALILGRELPDFRLPCRLLRIGRRIKPGFHGQFSRRMSDRFGDGDQQALVSLRLLLLLSAFVKCILPYECRASTSIAVSWRMRFSSETLSAIESGICDLQRLCNALAHLFFGREEVQSCTRSFGGIVRSTSRLLCRYFFHAASISLRCVDMSVDTARVRAPHQPLSHRLSPHRRGNKGRKRLGIGNSRRCITFSIHVLSTICEIPFVAAKLPRI